VWIAVGACALAGIGAASTLVWKKEAAQHADASGPALVAAAQSLSAREEVVDAAPARPRDELDAPAAAIKRNPAARPAQRPAAKVAAACAGCGVVESVQAVQRKGQATGVGAVAGTVLGGVIGNQFGGGDGRKAMTVVGAVGGGVAGHEVEKRARGTTVYVVKVRLDDGRVRSVEQAQSVAVGTRVRVDGGTLHRLPAAG
jgi:outer membrane lipoprotein SlyB